MRSKVVCRALRESSKLRIKVADQRCAFKIVVGKRAVPVVAEAIVHRKMGRPFETVLSIKANAMVDRAAMRKTKRRLFAEVSQSVADDNLIGGEIQRFQNTV